MPDNFDDTDHQDKPFIFERPDTSASLDAANVDRVALIAVAGTVAKSASRGAYMASGWGAVAGDVFGTGVWDKIPARLPVANTTDFLVTVTNITHSMPWAVSNGIAGAFWGAAIFGISGMAWNLYRQSMAQHDSRNETSAVVNLSNDTLRRQIRRYYSNPEAVQKLTALEVQLKPIYKEWNNLLANDFETVDPVSQSAQPKPKPIAKPTTWHDKLINWTIDTTGTVIATSASAFAVGSLQTNILSAATAADNNAALAVMIASAKTGAITGVVLSAVAAPHAAEMRRSVGNAVEIGFTIPIATMVIGAALGGIKDITESTTTQWTGHWKDGAETGLANGMHTLELIPAFAAAAFLLQLRNKKPAPIPAEVKPKPSLTPRPPQLDS